ncbi:hypothetical protein RB597_007489 [Gaeumannomyces tritici]
MFLLPHPAPSLGCPLAEPPANDPFRSPTTIPSLLQDRHDQKARVKKKKTRTKMATPLGLYSHLIAPPEGMTLMLREKVISLTGDSFEIKNNLGQDIFRVQGRAASLSGRKSIFDMQGRHLFDIQKEHFHLHTTFAANDPQGQKLMEVKSGFKLIGSKATATFKNAFSGASETLQMTGNWLSSSANIVDTRTGATVGTIQRKLSGRDLMFGQQTYALVVPGGVDMAVMVAMCIAMDEKNNEGGGFIF